MKAQRPWLRPTETFRASLVEDDKRVGARYVSPRTAWERKRALAAYGDAYSHADLDGAVAEFKFRGTGIDWYTVLGPSMGKAAVYVDGALELTVDTYASRVTYGAKRSVRGLSDGVHTIKVVTLGKRRSASIGTTIAVDRWVVSCSPQVRARARAAIARWTGKADSGRGLVRWPEQAVWTQPADADS